MGRTVPTFRREVEKELNRLRGFRNALRKGDREAFDSLLDASKRYSSAGSEAKSPNPLQIMVLMMMLDQEKRLNILERKLHDIRDRLSRD